MNQTDLQQVVNRKQNKTSSKILMNSYFPCNICDLQVNKAPVIVDIYRHIIVDTQLLPQNIVERVSHENFT